ncbi:Tripartite DNA replication factor [Apophysomyces ossiformis]|uniref:Tripartite DNA replication factor n=1 Tax=Apophysomyces ossiformis TaxID=679940 RepID=A0A8H7BS03_9FUNG|nr:Tripartite DNA replication factor [Apophysomyces ossiformis]
MVAFEVLSSKHDGTCIELPKFSVSELSKYPYYKCDKLIKLSGLRDTKALKESVNAKLQHLNAARCKRGNLFEEELLRKLGDDIVDHSRTPVSTSKEVLGDCKHGQILYQLACEMPEEFYEDERIGKKVYRLSKFIPDFLWIKEDPATKKRLIFVVDAKSSAAVTPSHQFQVASYAYLIKYIIRDIPDLEIHEMGGVLLPSDNDGLNIETFRMDIAIPMVKRFYTNELIAIVRNPKPDWLFNANCKTCNYSEHCKRDTANNLGIIPYTTKQRVQTVKCTPTKDIEDLLTPFDALQLKDTNNSADIDELTKGLQSVDLNSQNPYLMHPKNKPYHEAYISGKPQFLGNGTTMMAWDISHDIFISMIIDPIYEKPCAYSIRVYDTNTGCSVSGGHYESSTPSLQGTDKVRAELAKLVKSFVLDLHAVLERMVGLRCILYVYQSTVKTHMQKCLVDLVSTGAEMVEPVGIRDEICRMAIQCLLVLFQDTQLLRITGVDTVPTSDGVEKKNVCTVVGRMAVLDQLLEENIALGVPGFYSFKDVVQWMVDRDAEVIDDDTLYEAWYSENGLASCFEKHITALRLILGCYRSLAKGYESSSNEEQFPLKCAPFEWTQTQSFRSPILARLAFFKRLEAFTECDRIREPRIQDYRSLGRYSKVPGRGLCLEFVEFKDVYSPKRKVVSRGACFKLVQEPFRPPVQIQADMLSMNYFDRYLLVPDSREGILKVIKYPDMAYCREFKKPGISTVHLHSREQDGNILVLTGCHPSLKLQTGQRFRLYQRYTDYTTNKALDIFSEMDQKREDNSLFIDPNSWTFTRPHEFSKHTELTALKMRDEFDMSASQKEICEKAVYRRLQIIWGPPGSGKTEYLARFVNWYLKYLHQPSAHQARPFIIAVTAFTRLAITNLLDRIASVQETYSCSEHFRIVSLESGSESSPSRFLKQKAEKLEKAARDYSQKGITALVVGGTVWDWSKVKNSWLDWAGSDMMIIDESSQNKELNGFFQQIYGDDYVSRFPERLLRYNKTMFDALGADIRAALDPNKAVTILGIPTVSVEDALAHDWTVSAAEVATEAEAVAQLVKAHFSTRAVGSGLKNAAADRHVMVVTPHHRQRVAVQQHLQEFGSQVIVNTVEKLQGQECELVIACFAVRDFMENPEFMLDFRRWNVAISRARCKAIVVMTSDMLSRKTIQANGLQLLCKRDSTEGWVFINLLQHWAEHADAIVT